MTHFNHPNRSLLLFGFWLFSLLAFGQTKFSLSGYVRDAASGEDLIGATIYFPELETGTTTNIYGYYSHSVPPGTHQVRFSFVGMKDLTKTIQITANTKYNIELRAHNEMLEEVIISAKAADRNVRALEVGVTTMDVKEVEKIPVIFGEKDIVKTLQLMPGISTAGEGSSGFYVRGGSTDQNLMLLDAAPVYNAAHLMGFFSVFNGDALNNVTLYKGISPANYGGRLSSVMDVQMKEGNNKTLSGSGGLGLISSRLTLQAPIQKDQGAIIVSGRRTYADLLAKVFSDDYDDNALYFYDLNAKANYRLNDKDRLFISGYFGRDKLGLNEKIGIDWGNVTLTGRWNHLFNDRLFSNTSLVYSKYDYEAQMVDLTISSGIEDWNLKSDFQYYTASNNTLKFGINLIDHSFLPGKVSTGESNFLEDIDIKRYALEGAAYTSYETDLPYGIKMDAGLRFSAFSIRGPGDFYSFDEAGEVTDTTTYGSHKNVAQYGGLEPRLILNIPIGETASIKAGYARNYQYMHLLTNSSGGTPFDVWQPSTDLVKPQRSDQVSMGYFRNFKDNLFETSVEVYYKDLHDLIDYKDGADLFLNPLVESQLVSGKGRAYGLELMLKKAKGRLTGWISYTLAKSERKFDAINDGHYYPSAQDRTHDITLVGMYQLNKRWNLSASWIYYTGNAITLPIGKYMVDGQLVTQYSERNNGRMPDTHRLDLGATCQLKKTDRFESSLNISLYNAYGRKNPYSISFQQVEGSSFESEAVQMSLFSFVPSITYNFKF